MGIVDHLKNARREELILEVAFGAHIVEGDLGKSLSDGTNVYVQQFLGEAYGKGWKGVSKGIWFKGIRIPENAYKFYPGIQSPGNSDPVQGIDEHFNKDTPHSNTAWIRFALPTDLAADYQDNKNKPPEGFRTIVECQTGDIYDENGNVVESDVYLTNAADAAVFLCKVVRRYPNARINWQSLDALRQHNDDTYIFDWTTLPEGVGLTGSYYSGTNFGTLILKRIDAAVEFNLSDGSPAFTVPIDNFSARWEGKIRPRYSETYTFYLDHDNGCRLWVNGVQLYNVWQNDGQGAYTSGTPAASTPIALTADEYYDIKLEWNEGGGPGEIRLAWESASNDREVVPQERLYPKNEAQKNYECHSKFVAPTSFEDALVSVLASSNAFYQEADGQIHFYSFDTLAPTFAFDETNIKTETFVRSMRYSQIEAANQPTRFQAEGLDLDSQYLEKFAPPVFFDVSNDDFSGHIRTRNVNVGNTRRPQAMKLLKLAATLAADGWIVNFDGMPQTYPVLAGDLITLSITRTDQNTGETFTWTNKKFLVLESNDKSIDSGSDDRVFKLLEWKPYF